MSTNNSPASSDEFWEGRVVTFVLGSPRNRDEEKEADLVNELYKMVKDKPEAVGLLASIVASYNARLYRLRFFLDHLSDNLDLPPPVKSL